MRFSVVEILKPHGFKAQAARAAEQFDSIRSTNNKKSWREPGFLFVLLSTLMIDLSFEHWLVVLSAFISIAGSAVYIRDTLLGRTKPNRVTWFMWAFASLVATGAALSAGADPWATVRVFIGGLVPLLIFLFSFVNKESYWQITSFDIGCGFFSLLALVFWVFAGSPVIAVLLAVVADGFAALPTILKAWRYPETESGLTFIASLVSVLLVLPSIPEWNIENSAFQIYLLCTCVAIIFAIYRKRVWVYFSTRAY